MAYEYLFLALPALPDSIGEKLAIEPSAIWNLIKAEGDKASALAEAVLYAFDVKVLERMNFGLKAYDGSICTADELEDRTKLPAWLSFALADHERESGDYSFNGVWRAYYANLKEILDECGCGFLENWFPWDVGLKNAVAEFRSNLDFVEAKAGEPIDAHSFVPASEFKAIVESLMSLKEKGDEAWREMDAEIANGRIAKAREMAPPYIFDLNELMSYVVQYMVYKEFEYLQQ